jgi:hypothetical protein
LVAFGIYNLANREKERKRKRKKTEREKKQKAKERDEESERVNSRKFKKQIFVREMPRNLFYFVFYISVNVADFCLTTIFKNL